MDSQSWILWVGVIAVALHAFEQYIFGWVNWANHELGPRFGASFRESDFLIANLGLIFIALAGAAIGWWAPAISLALAGFFIITAVFGHMIPSARAERLTPGTITAVFIYLPVGAAMYWAAGDDKVLTFGAFLLSLIFGAFLIAFPLLILNLKDRLGWDEQYVADLESDRQRREEAAATAAAVPPAAEEIASSEDDTMLLAEDAATEGPGDPASQ